MNRTKKTLIAFLGLILALCMLTACQPKANTNEPDTNVTETEKQEEPTPSESQKPKEEEAAEVPKDKEEGKAPDAPVTAPAEPKVDETKPPEAPIKDDSSSMKIEGSGVEKEITLSLDELKAMKDAYFEDDFYSLNSYGTREHFHFKGVKVKAILDQAGLKSTAAKIKFVASDGYAQELSVELALKEDYIDQDNLGKKFPVIIAWHENGKDFDPKKGAPFRLVVGQKEVDDMNKPQWVSNIAKIIVE
ncbi:MAG: molybdopterin-dependent oxidoreductase [Clostridiales bacterium]|nr:molybdopterin-dependent oxidoreductase [Clostridiales bacterium]